MSDLVVGDDANTPLSEEELEGLIPSYITFRHELNAVEQENILEAQQWAFRLKHKNLLEERFLRNLHKRMFGKVWKWAGTFRKTTKNIGVAAWDIQVGLRTLLDDTHFWVENETFPIDEIAARFHHRLVFIHPFPNGNGRHARLATDLLLAQLGQPCFSWGRTSLAALSETRKEYVTALRDADRGDFTGLLAFVRS